MLIIILTRNIIVAIQIIINCIYYHPYYIYCIYITTIYILTTILSFSDCWYRLKLCWRRGLRASVYEAAGKSGAFHSNENKKLSIDYSSLDTLTVSVLFKERSQCGKFQSTLEGMIMRYFDSEATVVHKRTYTAVTWSPNLMAVLASDYTSALITQNLTIFRCSLFSLCMKLSM